MRTISIGDIHGCLTEMQDLLGQLDIRASDRLVLLGDLVDRGPDSRGVIDYAMELSRELGPRFVLVRGNHEDKHLRFRRHQESTPGSANPVLLSPAQETVHHSLQAEHWSWLEQYSQLYWRGGRGLLAIHAGVLDSIRQLPDDPAELERWPTKARRKLRACALHLRHVSSEGHFVSLGDESEHTCFWGERYDGRLGFVVHGHSATAGQLLEHPHSLGIDTGCVYGHSLTAAIWNGPTDETRGPDEVLSVPAKQPSRTPALES